MNCEIICETDSLKEIDCEELSRRVVAAALEQEGCPYEAQVSITITDAESVRVLNRTYRGIDSATDVLSFPMLDLSSPADLTDIQEDEYFDCFDPSTGELMLGDIVINAERVYSQAGEYGHSVTREFAFLVAHSMLHLLGYDHIEEEDRILMEERQRLLMETLGISR